MKKHASTRLKTLLAAIGSVLLGTAFLAPASVAGAETSHSPTTWRVHVGAQSPNGAIQGMQFLPGDIWIDVGDTVHWTADSMEPHTVTFLPVGQLPAPFDPTDPAQTTPSPQHSIAAPGDMRNSGVLSTLQFSELPATYTSYNLTFTGTGDFVYYCLIHGKAMKGTVHVAAAGTAYPHSQRFYDRQFRKGRAEMIRDGNRFYAKARTESSSHHVFVGAVDEAGMLMIMRFIRTTVHVHVGDTIDFDWSLNNGDPVPHTVTFGPEPPAPFPVGDPTHFTGGSLSSGVLPTAGPGTHFRVTFDKAGTYPYICMFHDGMGMVGKVVVTAGHDD
ncbi:cupredoxin domain-containing protein [Intrasporangium flavum]|uniref:cupredoxin domain-containing protein n=1 Tax=Intrasporangium flavum TaxID=1428657 RepID=UPI00096DFBBF|nr:plastocyanin/azurin family copper-binding protein [Intrasporangium flavum]